MPRLIHIGNAPPGGTAHWLRVIAVIVAAVVMSGGLAWWLSSPSPPAGLKAVVEADKRPAPALATTPVATVQADPKPAAAESAVSCPIQSLELVLGSQAPQTLCVDATRVRQVGSVRTYEVQAGGVDGWALQVDVAGGELFKASLVARDGRRYACEAPQCAGLSIGRHDTRGVRSVTLAGLTLRQAAPNAGGDNADNASEVARLSARLSAPSDEQLPGLACTGPSVSITARDGSSHKFCGQGGAGFEVADDGNRNYRFQDHEGQTLTVAVAPDQRVSGVQFGSYACRGNACGGASTSSAQPDNDMAERSFYFGRTQLNDAGAPMRPTPDLIVDGTLVMPSQE